MAHEYFIIALLIGAIVLSIAVAWSDFTSRRIPNNYLFGGILFFLAVFAGMFYVFPFNFVIKGFLFSIVGMTIGGAMLYVPYKLRQVGAGDVKLLMVLGLLLGPKGIILTLLVGAMIGGIWALILAWRIGGLGHMWHNMKFMARSAYLSGFKEMGWDLRSKGAVAMPYGVALGAGAILICIEQLNVHITRLANAV